MSLGLNRSGIILATSPRVPVGGSTLRLGVRISRVAGRSCGRKFRGVGALTRLDLDMLARERKPLGFSRTTSLFASQMAVCPPPTPSRVPAPGCSVSFHAMGESQIWLERSVLNRLAALRGPHESYSVVILRLAKG